MFVSFRLSHLNPGCGSQSHCYVLWDESGRRDVKLGGIFTPANGGLYLICIDLPEQPVLCHSVWSDQVRITASLRKEAFEVGISQGLRSQCAHFWAIKVLFPNAGKIFGHVSCGKGWGGGTGAFMYTGKGVDIWEDLPSFFCEWKLKICVTRWKVTSSTFPKKKKKTKISGSWHPV